MYAKQSESRMVIESESEKKTAKLPASSYQPPKVELALAPRLPPLLLRERTPEPQRLVPRPSHDRLPVRAHRQVQHAVRVPRQRRHHVQRRVLPDADLVLRGRRRVAVCGDELVRRQ